jgi:hypothetical protein
MKATDGGTAATERAGFVVIADHALRRTFDYS